MTEKTNNNLNNNNTIGNDKLEEYLVAYDEESIQKIRDEKMQLVTANEFFGLHQEKLAAERKSFRPLPIYIIPSNIAKKVVEDIIEYGNVQKGILGISTIPMNSPYAIEKGINEIDGVYIAQVEEDSGAFDAELAEGDIIKKVDNVDIRKYSDLIGYIASKRPGDELMVSILREKEVLEVPVTLKERQTMTIPILGFEIKNLTEKDMKTFRTKKGVKIIGVPETFRAYDLEGKVLISFGEDDIKNIQDARTKFGRITRYGRTSITMLNDKGERERLIIQ